MSDDPTDLLKAELGMVSEKYEHDPHHHHHHHHHHHEKVITPSFEPAKVVTHKVQPKVSHDKPVEQNEQQKQHEDEGK
ncbi:unnamed protein product [Rotaria sp. Silwood1]|nr:unnamed protein product [Rotaria sp. Silwood1]CAF3540127.1 unnamed protein product [Rotaria sp. Silwood1]CAF5030171.1 unnamed protein product [Rotaria sp. Silwood1]